jgi:pilus assembly protein CpaE
MTTLFESAKILLVTDNQSIIKTTRTILDRTNNLKLISKKVTSDALFPTIVETRPDVILLDFDFQHNPFYLVDRIVSEYSSCDVIAILTDSESANLDRVVLSGARAFIRYPYEAQKLLVTIKRVIELSERKQSPMPEVSVPTPEVRPSYIFTIFSPKGGAGTTTIATNLAIALNKRMKEDVCLIDGKLQFGHVSLYLNLLTGNSITDLIAHADMLDQQLINQVTIKHKSGINVLPSPNSVTEAQGITPEKLFKVIQSLQTRFPNIIIDGGSHLDENAVTFMDASNQIIVVINPNLAAMRDVRQFMEVATSLSYPKEKILFLLNLTGRKADVKQEEIERILKMNIFETIPTDENLALSSWNEGVPIVLLKPRHPISRAYEKIAQKMEGIIRMANPTEPVKSRI